MGRNSKLTGCVQIVRGRADWKNRRKYIVWKPWHREHGTYVYRVGFPDFNKLFQGSTAMMISSDLGNLKLLKWIYHSLPET